MNSFKFKTFIDNIHGYINVPEDYVYLLIDTEIFQRLRNIEQTGMRSLYPSARHDRFIHSLGVFYLGSRAFANFRKNVKEVSDNQSSVNGKHYYIFDTDKNNIFWDRCAVLFEVACLLHDCGHAPFSHTFEFIYEYPSTKICLKEKIIQFINSSKFINDFNESGSPHQRMSALVVCAEYREVLSTILSNRDLHHSYSITDDLEFVVRMIIGCKYSDDTKENRIKNCLISLLTSSNSLDMDTLDYIIRDSKLAGFTNMTVDIERFLTSITIVEKTIFDNKLVCNASVSTNILSGTIKKMEFEKAKIMCQYKGAAQIVNFDGKIKGSTSIAGKYQIKSGEKAILPSRNLFNFDIENLYADTAFKATIKENIELIDIINDWVEIVGAPLILNEDYDGKISCFADYIMIDSGFIDGSITGVLSGELLGNYESLGGRLTCELGFKESSISIIQSIINAINYQSQWIYTHHKVVYYQNYLLIELFRECIMFLLDRDGQDPDRYMQIYTSILSWENMIIHDDGNYYPFEFYNTSYFRPVDADIISLFNKCKYLDKKNSIFANSLSCLLAEFNTRSYKKSLWKSYEEFCLFLGFLSADEKHKLFDLVLAKSRVTMTNQYGYFDSEWEEKLKDFGMSNVMWINVKKKLIKINPNISILSGSYISSYATISLNNSKHTTHEINFFYIYYKENYANKSIDINGFKLFIREQLGLV